MKTMVHPGQRRLFDPFQGVIGSAGWALIEGGWQSLFRGVLLERMPVGRLAKGMSEDQGRPSAELYAMLGLLLIREFQGWTVPQAHEAVLFRTDIQYALNLEPGFEVTQRTIERYLQRMQQDEELGEELFREVTDTLLTSMEVKVQKQRLDSTHVLSDMACLGRARMIGVALKRFFQKVRRHDAALLSGLSEDLLKRYEKSSDSGVFGGLKDTEARRVALQQVAEDLLVVLQHFEQSEPIGQWNQYHQLRTIFDQQCELREEFIEVRAKTGGRVIQNVSDPNATYSGHKGAGYQVQFSETFNDDGLPNLITAAQVETAVDSDADAVEPLLEDLRERDHLPQELLADAGYGSNANVAIASEQGVTLIAPVPGSKAFDPDEVGYDRFTLNEAHEVVACPQGHAPKSTRYNAEANSIWAQIDPSLCAACPLAAHCRVQRDAKTGQPNGRVQFRADAPQSAQRRRHEQTPEYRDQYRWRSGIESTNSGLKRRLGLKRLRVRSMKAVALTIYLKLAGWNLLRAVALRAARTLQAATARQPSLAAA